MNNTKNNKKEEERKRLAKALKQNILKRKKQQQISKLVYSKEVLKDDATKPSKEPLEVKET